MHFFSEAKQVRTVKKSVRQNRLGRSFGQFLAVYFSLEIGHKFSLMKAVPRSQFDLDDDFGAELDLINRRNLFK